ncbi:MAG TPA: hypothetical protein VJ835_01540 [Fimbriimonadaceae bacterium]|nr:hypothetical protein [Fimbriimonadaceae bacterium]
MLGVLILASVSWPTLPPSYLDLPAQHTHHAALFSNGVPEFNRLVLRGVDEVQSHAMLGGGYFIGVKANPPESPIGYTLRLEGRPLLDPPRTSSFCTGASYGAFIEALNLWMPQGRSATGDWNRLPETVPLRLSDERFEALRMQESSGRRREDHVKFWGHWNADGFGNHFALVQYSKMGSVVKPQQAKSGDFINISWKSGNGHSAVFLGWCLDRRGRKAVRFWSSQVGTCGLGDQVSSIDSIRSVCIVRVTKPLRIYGFNPAQQVDQPAPGFEVGW